MNKKSWYVLRIVAGLYLTYLGINLFRNRTSEGSMNKTFVLFMAFIFVVVGVLYAASSIKKVWAMRNEEPIDEVEEDGEDQEEQEDEADEAESDEDTDKLESGESENNISENADDNDVDEN